MALTDKNLVVTPNIGSANDPKIVFSGADASTTAQNITLSVYPTNNGTLSVEGSAGQLLSIANLMSGTIYSVNDVSGIPSIEVLDTGVIKLGQYGGNILIGTGTDNGYKLNVIGESSIPRLSMNRASQTSAGQLYYSSSYTSWQTYMGPSGTAGQGYSGTITTPTGSYVTSWALRSFIENAANYGWTWESGTSTSTTPSIVAELQSSSGIFRTTGSFRAPYFYDQDNTVYYLDAASNSNLNGITMAGSLNLNASGNAIVMNGSASTNIQMNAGGTLRGYMYSDTSGIGILHNGGGWSVKIPYGQTYSEITNSTRSPYFYDLDSTGYYIRGSGTSVLNQINLSGIIRRNSITSGYLEGNYPTSTDGSSSSCIYTIGGAYQPGTTNLGNMYGIGYTVGNGSSNPGLSATGWGMYVASSGTSRVFLDSDNGYGISSNSWRAPYFYDSANTNYYIHASSTSVLNALNVNGTFNCFAASYFYANMNTGSGSSPALMAYSTGNNGAIMSFHKGGYYAINMGLDSDTVFRIGGWSAAANLFQMDMSGNLTMAGNVNTNSDRNLKKNIEDFDGLHLIDIITPVKYNWIKDDKLSYGVIAQEIEEILPDLVSTDNMGVKSVAYVPLIGILLKAVKEQQQQIESLILDINSIKERL